jgi:ERCC4-type nuclease|uniref:ERCC4 domain-containing protein n=1 Tax=viral metagenome TaxID=1070528 RepID=A0A6C0JGA2_9ZZZZ
MTIIIDYREKKLIQEMQKVLGEAYDDYVVVKNLLLGDISIQNKEEQDEVIIERKTLTDLIASIKDGRYNEQKIRLNASDIPNHNIMFLIEGDKEHFRQYYGEAQLKLIYSSVFSLSYLCGYTFCFSDGIYETAQIVSQFYSKYLKTKDRPLHYGRLDVNAPNVIVENAPVQYASCIKSVKNSNINKDNVWHIMLKQIPFVSDTIANALLQEFKSLPLLIDALRNNVNVIDNFKISDNNGKQRKISTRVVAKIVELLI